MVGNKLNKRIAKALHQLPPRGIKLVIGIALLTASLNALWIAYRVGYTNGQTGCGYPCVPEHQDFTLQYMQIRIGLALVISAVCLWSRRAIGFFISAIALTWAGKEYVWWYLESLRRLKAMDLNDFSELKTPSLQHVNNLLGATWWDIAVLIVIILLFIWQIKTLAQILNSSYGKRTV
ncbi:MAG TPA: hypothetical protein VF544_09650 [Pyrinomonadaceae bacterium]|jgi:hypothetical protein